MTSSTRDRILDALKDILIAHGSSAVTLEAVAAAAGISKGGLLYHFRSKTALIDGLAQRLRDYTEANMADAGQHGVVRTFLRTSTPGSEEAAHYWAVLTAMRGSKADLSTEAEQVLHDVFAQWSVLLREEVPDPILAETIRLVGDGLYLTAISRLPQPADSDVQHVINRLIDQAAAAKPTET